MNTQVKNKRFKYPRTIHLPWSPGFTDGDVKGASSEIFNGREVVITEKMDGENTTLYNDHTHARSIDSRHHSSRDWLKRWHAEFAHEIPNGWRICGENLYAQHSIVYDKLKSYFYGFSIWNDKNYCLSWDETLDWFRLLEITTPKVIYRGLWDEKLVRSFKLDTDVVEGYVVRLAEQFDFDSFNSSVAKWVRKGHVQTDKHWMHAELKLNGLAEVKFEHQHEPYKATIENKEVSDETK